MKRPGDRETAETRFGMSDELDELESAKPLRLHDTEPAPRRERITTPPPPEPPLTASAAIEIYEDLLAPLRAQVGDIYDAIKGIPNEQEMLDELGSPIRVGGMQRDITSIKASMEGLKRSIDLLAYEFQEFGNETRMLVTDLLADRQVFIAERVVMQDSIMKIEKKFEIFFSNGGGGHRGNGNGNGHVPEE